jgi:hypothetical protein
MKREDEKEAGMRTKKKSDDEQDALQEPASGLLKKKNIPKMCDYADWSLTLLVVPCKPCHTAYDNQIRYFFKLVARQLARGCW